MFYLSLKFDATINHRETFGSVESVKAASDVYMPIDGEITAVNEVGCNRQI